MDREGFRSRLKQYKKAREENPGLTYWEFVRNNTDENGNLVSTKESPIYTEEYAKEQEWRQYAQKVVDEIDSKHRTFDKERNDTDRAGAIPYIPEKSITLTNAGKDTGVTLSTNVLDSIAKYAKIAELSLSSALGLAGQESTFGKGYNVEAKEMLPSTLVSNWNYGNPQGRSDRSENPYMGLWNAANKKVNGYQGYYDDNLDFVYDLKFIDILKGGLPYADKLAKKLRTDTPVLEHAFRKYKSGLYNPNDPDHTRMVEERGKALMKFPEIQKWMKENNIKYADGGEVGENEYSPVWPRTSKTERQIYFDRINPAAGFGFGDFVSQGMNYYFPDGKRLKAPKEDEARWAAYLGLPYDKTYAPDTKIRFAHDKDYPNRQYQGLSKDAKNEIREEIIPILQKSYSKLGDKWIQITDEKPTDIIRNDEMYYPRLEHIGDLGKFGIREVNNSGIYEVGDKYDFPWYVPIPNRADGYELMIRDTIWSDKAKPELYIQRKAEGGPVEPDPLEVLERSKPRVSGIPINDKPLSGTDPLGELYLNLVSGNAVRKAITRGVNTMVRKSFYDNYKELLKAGWNRHKAYSYASPELAIDILPDISKGFDYITKGVNYTHAVTDLLNNGFNTSD